MKNYCGRIVLIRQVTPNTQNSFLFKACDNVNDFENVGCELIDCFEKCGNYSKHEITKTKTGEILYITLK